MAPQALALDFAILQNYCSYLKEGATVLIPLCPFTCMAGFKNKFFIDKYYTILHHSSIPEFSNEKKIKIMKSRNNPLMEMSFKEIINLFLQFPIRWLRSTKNKLYQNVKRNLLTKKKLKADALKWINGWKKEFGISDLHNLLNVVQQNNMDSSASLLQELVIFCQDRGYRPVIIFPPVTKYLNVYFDRQFRELYIDSFLEKACVRGVPYFNYMDDERFSDKNLFFNSFFLNLQGRKLFTKQVLQDLGIA
jgi:hypothetical protein